MWMPFLKLPPGMHAGILVATGTLHPFWLTGEVGGQF